MRPFDPRRLDLRAFAHAGAALEGAWPVAGFERLGELLAWPDDGGTAADETVSWSARGAEVKAPGGAREIWLHLRADVTLPLLCQRCLQPCRYPVRLQRQFQFVAGEAAAAEIDAEVEHDVLALERDFDLHPLLEDELLLALPLVPRHDDCPQPLPMPAEDNAGEPSGRTFAALAALRHGSG